MSHDQGNPAATEAAPSREGAGAAWAAGTLGARLLWLVRLRWLAILGVSLAVAAAGPLTRLLPAESLAPMLLIILAMAAYNLLFGRLARRTTAARGPAIAQILLDLASLTGLLYYSGGPSNPFFPFYVFHVIIGGILLSRTESYLIAFVAFSLFTGMVLLETAGWIPRHRPSIFPPLTHDFILGLLLALASALFFSAQFTTTIMKDLRRTTVELGQEKEKLDGIIQGIGAGLVILDRQGRVAWSNAQAARWFPAALPGRICHEALASRPEPCTGCRAGEATPEDPPCSLDHVFKDRRYQVTQTLVRDPSGDSPTRLLLIQDVAQERHMEEQLYQSSKLAAVGTLASGIAHEINNPLASISASVDYLRELAAERRLQEPIPKHLRRISDHVYRCKDIIDALLALARKEDRDTFPTDVNRCIQELVRLGERKISPRLRLGRDLPQARANPRLLQNVLLNLLLNARDAAGPEGTVELATWTENGTVSVSVRDDGPGIPPDRLTRIFEPFYTTKTVGQGTGLGLYLCHRMVEAMSGRIEVSAEPGAGTTFSVHLRLDAPRTEV